MEKMREESVSETQSKARLYFNRGKLDRALKRAVNVQRREGINYEAMDVERGSNDPPWNIPAPRSRIYYAAEEDPRKNSTSVNDFRL